MRLERWVRESRNRRSCRDEFGRKVTIVKRKKDLMKYRVYISGFRHGYFNTLRDALKYLSGL